MTDQRPNIVFIMPDQWRHDAFGFAGNRVIETPNVDALASQGAVFTGAHCESPICQPSRASTLTGVYVRDHGLPTNVPRAGGKRFPGPHELTTFPQRLRDAGYYTAEIGKMHFENKTVTELSRRPESEGALPEDLRDRRRWLEEYGFDYSAEEIDKPGLVRGVGSNYTEYLRHQGLLDHWRAYHYEASSPWIPGLAGSGPEPLDPEDTLDMFIGRQACDFLRDYDRDQPFFLWVAPVGPHHPLDAPSPYCNRYDPADIPLGPLGAPEIPDNEYGAYLRQKQKEIGCPDAEIPEVQAEARHYYANCTQDDAVVGRVVSALEDNGLAGNTWVLVGSDHGEMLGDHGFVTKELLYRSSVQIPSVIKPPHGLDLPLVVDELTQGFDLSATILDIAGADRDGHLGQSLLPALRGEPVGREAVFSEIAGFCMVATRRYKLVVHSATVTPQQLFDLENDPHERRDLCSDPRAREIVQMLMERYVRPFLAEKQLPAPGDPARSEHA